MRNRRTVNLLIIISSVACLGWFFLADLSSPGQFQRGVKRIPDRVRPDSNSVVFGRLHDHPLDTEKEPPHEVTWREVESREYPVYLEQLREAGCPGVARRLIVIHDVNEYFHQKRLREAIALDYEWWRTDSDPNLLTILYERGKVLEEDRQARLGKLLGPTADLASAGEAVYWSTVPLTGAKLGALPPHVHNAIQDICEHAIKQAQDYFSSCMASCQPVNFIHLAKLKQQTRRELAEVLRADVFEEFLLRFSENAARLRHQLMHFNATPEEFRRLFLALDPIDRQMELQYGAFEFLSEEQKRQWDHQREAAIRQMLGAERYHEYVEGRNRVASIQHNRSPGPRR